MENKYRGKSGRARVPRLALAPITALLLYGVSLPARGQQSGAGSTQNAEAAISSWPSKPQEVARKMMAKYGQPNEVTSSRLIWTNNGPWKETILYRDEIPHKFPKPHMDLLEQIIDYKAPVQKYTELAKFDGSVIVERTRGTIAARCDKEEMNFLALNLANDVATGKRSVEDARAFYGKTAKAFMEGKQDPYVQGFQFQVAKGGTTDPDREMMK